MATISQQKMHDLVWLHLSPYKIVANAIFLSKVIYLIPLWSGYEKYLKNALQIVQNKAARIVTKSDSYTSTQKMLDQFGWLSIDQLGPYHIVWSCNSKSCNQNLHYNSIRK